MPIQYSGIMEEHRAVREKCGIIDVSHMGEFIISGSGATEFLNDITIIDVAKINDWQALYSAMFYDDERPRNVWIEQLALAERIGTKDSPKLIPDSFEHRVDMFGLCAIILGEDGLTWNMRILIDTPLAQKYGYSEEASSSAPEKISEVITLIDRRLEAQEKQGSRYLVGDALTAVDIYWATMSMTILPVPLEIMPKTKQNQGMLMYFAANSEIPEIANALTERIKDHQQYILTTYCETPAVLGGDPL